MGSTDLPSLCRTATARSTICSSCLMWSASRWEKLWLQSLPRLVLKFQPERTACDVLRTLHIILEKEHNTAAPSQGCTAVASSCTLQRMLSCQRVAERVSDLILAGSLPSCMCIHDSSVCSTVAIYCNQPLWALIQNQTTYWELLCTSILWLSVAQVVAGLEPEATNSFLQQLARAAVQGNGAQAVQVSHCALQYDVWYQAPRKRQLWKFTPIGSLCRLERECKA